MGTDVYFIPRGCPSPIHRMGVLRCTFVLLGLVVASLAGMIDEDLICDHFDRFSNSYAYMQDVASVEEIAWECNTDVYTGVAGGKCDKMQASCYKDNNEYLLLDVTGEDFVEYIEGDGSQGLCKRICDNVFERIERFVARGAPDFILAKAINRMKTGSWKRHRLPTL